MKSLFKLLFASFLTSFSFVAAHASVVETDTVMSQKYVETENVKANILNVGQEARLEYLYVNGITSRKNLDLMSNRGADESIAPMFTIFSMPYGGAQRFSIGFVDDTTGKKNLTISSYSSTVDFHPMSFIASEYNFGFEANQTGVMNVDGKIVCKEEIRVAEVNTNKVNSDEVNTKGITAREINVEMDNAADYVFEEGYDLKSLDEVEAFVKSNKHLPGVPSASEFKENGMNVSEMSNLLLEKVEELTLHLIRLQKEVEQLREENKALKR